MLMPVLLACRSCAITQQRQQHRGLIWQRNNRNCDWVFCGWCNFYRNGCSLHTLLLQTCRPTVIKAPAPVPYRIHQSSATCAALILFQHLAVRLATSSPSIVLPGLRRRLCVFSNSQSAQKGPYGHASLNDLVSLKAYA